MSQKSLCKKCDTLKNRKVLVLDKSRITLAMQHAMNYPLFIVFPEKSCDCNNYLGGFNEDLIK